MAEVNSFANQTLHPNTPFESLFLPLDPISLILQQHWNSVTTDSYVLERGSRYRAYAELRESMLREKSLMGRESVENQTPTPPMKKQVKFGANAGDGGSKGCSVLAQSVPDFSAALRKENRKPHVQLQTRMKMTPLAKNRLRNSAIQSNSRRSKSASAGDKKVGNGLRGINEYEKLRKFGGTERTVLCCGDRH